MSEKISKKEKDKARWECLLEQLLVNPEEPIIITTFRRKWNSASHPVAARGIDKCEYVIKGRQAGRQIINDQIVARLGVALGAPVSQPQIVEISQELLESEPSFSFLSSGKAHATHFIPDCFDDRDSPFNKQNTPWENPWGD